MNSAASPTLSAIVLAGGRSRRMGTDKALLEMPDGGPLIARTIQVAQQLTEDVVVVSGWGDRYQSALQPELANQVRFIQEKAAAGPLNGFAQGWAHTQTDWCLLLACDLPHLQSEPLQQWWAWLTENTSPRQAMASLVPKLSDKKSSGANTKQWEPLCGFYHHSGLPHLNCHLRGSHSDSNHRRQRSFQAWLTGIPLDAYIALPQSMLFNCNTPADWAEAQQTIF